jgi:hypothetical protein
MKTKYPSPTKKVYAPPVRCNCHVFPVLTKVFITSSKSLFSVNATIFIVIPVFANNFNQMKKKILCLILFLLKIYSLNA